MNLLELYKNKINFTINLNKFKYKKLEITLFYPFGDRKQNFVVLKICVFDHLIFIKENLQNLFN